MHIGGQSSDLSHILVPNYSIHVEPLSLQLFPIMPPFASAVK